MAGVFISLIICWWVLQICQQDLFFFFWHEAYRQRVISDFSRTIMLCEFIQLNVYSD